MLELHNIPLSVLNRALDLSAEPRELSVGEALDALLNAGAQKDVVPDHAGIVPLAQAVAEYMSLAGPWAEDSGEYAGENGYAIS